MHKRIQTIIHTSRHARMDVHIQTGTHRQEQRHTKHAPEMPALRLFILNCLPAISLLSSWLSHTRCSATRAIQPLHPNVTRIRCFMAICTQMSHAYAVHGKLHTNVARICCSWQSAHKCRTYMLFMALCTQGMSMHCSRFSGEGNFLCAPYRLQLD